MTLNSLLCKNIFSHLKLHIIIWLTLYQSMMKEVLFSQYYSKGRSGIHKSQIHCLLGCSLKICLQNILCCPSVNSIEVLFRYAY